MLRTFKAVLNGNQLEWIDEMPEQVNHPLKVYVTVLEEELIVAPYDQSKKMAAALEKLAASNSFAEVDPVSWQREIRQDSSLPDRGE
jgi:hypothetical protein